MKILVTGVSGQLGHDVMNELDKRGIGGIGSDIRETYGGAQDGTAVCRMPCFFARIQAIMFTSSCAVTALRLSEPRTSGSFIVIGLAPFAAMVNTSSVFFAASSRDSSRSMTTTSFCSPDKSSAMLYPSFPAPTITIRMKKPPTENIIHHFPKISE